MKNGVNTTQMPGNSARPMTEREIDHEFEMVAGTLAGFEKEKIRLPLTGRTGEEVVELGFNGRMFRIRRGEEVHLPKPLVEILHNAGLIA